MTCDVAYTDKQIRECPPSPSPSPPPAMRYRVQSFLLFVHRMCHLFRVESRTDGTLNLLPFFTSFVVYILMLHTIL